MAHGDELTYVSLGEGATSEGEFWESLNTACTLHLPVLYVVADNGFAISVPSSISRRRRSPSWCGVFAACRCTRSTAGTTSRSEPGRAAIVAEVRAGVGPALIHATVTRPYSHSSQDTQSKYRPPKSWPRRPAMTRSSCWSGP